MLCFAALFAVVVADGYGKAYSSVHISRHDGHPEVVKVHGDGHGHGHGHEHEYIDYYVCAEKL